MTTVSPKKQPTSPSSKTALKSLLKECLRELIEEGAFDKVMMKENTFVKQQTSVPMPEQRQQGRHLQNQQTTQQDPNNDFLNNFVGGVAREASAGNSKMAEMLKEAFLDTAMTTMVNQREGKGYGMLDEHLPSISSTEQEKMDREIAELEALAGSSVNRWASVAGIKKTH